MINNQKNNFNCNKSNLINDNNVISMNNNEQSSCAVTSRTRNLKTYNILFKTNSIEIDKNKINDNNNKENYYFFSSIIYNKATGKLNFTHNASYSDEQFVLDPNVSEDSHTTINLKKPVKFDNVDYNQLQYSFLLFQ